MSYLQVFNPVTQDYDHVDTPGEDMEVTGIVLNNRTPVPQVHEDAIILFSEDDALKFINSSGDIIEVGVAEEGGDAEYPRRIEISPFMGRTVVQGTWTHDIDATYQVDFLNGYVYNSTAAQNDEINFPCMMDEGTWKLEIMSLRSTNTGIITVYIDGVSVGTIDTYNGSTLKNDIQSLSGIVISTPGNKTVSLKIATKNGSSSGYRVNLQAICLLRTGA